MDEHENVWCKMTCPERLTDRAGPPYYDDVVPFAKRLVDAFPDRVLWGTDWPHPNLKTHMPDDGLLVDFDPEASRRPRSCSASCWSTIPMRLYWPELSMAANDNQFDDIPRHHACSTARQLAHGLSA